MGSPVPHTPEDLFEQATIRQDSSVLTQTHRLYTDALL